MPHGRQSIFVVCVCISVCGGGGGEGMMQGERTEWVSRQFTT